MNYAVISNNMVVAYCDDLFSANSFISKQEDKSKFEIVEKLGMGKCVSRITSVNGKIIYNNKDFWLKESQNVYDNYDKFRVSDFLGNSVPKDRFAIEMNSNRARIAGIDGSSGEIDYNMVIGNEFISLFREECIKTDFDYSSGVSPLTIWAKLQHISIPRSIITHDSADNGVVDADLIGMLFAGCFREVAQALQLVEPDAFLTSARIEKYAKMLTAADVITYTTDADYYYKV